MSGVWKSPAIIVVPSISPSISVSICCIYLGAPVLEAYILTIVISSSWKILLSLNSVLVFLYGLCFNVYFVSYEHCTSCFPVFPFSWNTFFHPLTFSLYVSFALRWISCRNHIGGSCFFIQSSTLCLLIKAFSPLTFKVIIDKYVIIDILNLIFQLILCFSFVPFFFWLDEFLLFYTCVLFFLVFVNVLFGFDSWLPCFSCMLTPSYICLL